MDALHAAVHDRVDHARGTHRLPAHRAELRIDAVAMRTEHAVIVNARDDARRGAYRAQHEGVVHVGKQNDVRLQGRDDPLDVFGRSGFWRAFVAAPLDLFGHHAERVRIGDRAREQRDGNARPAEFRQHAGQIRLRAAGGTDNVTERERDAFGAYCCCCAPASTSMATLTLISA